MSFRYKDRTDGNAEKLMHLPTAEFTRRYLSHVLPNKFVRIRHFGFLGSRGKAKNIEIARQCLKVKTRIEVIKDEDYKQLLKRLIGVDITACPCCKAGKMLEVATLLAHPNLLLKSSDTS